MTSSTHGTNTLAYEVTNIERGGFWLLVDDKEYFVAFDDYPIFRSATVDQILRVERSSPEQFHWPALDADIELAALENPTQFVLRYK